MAADNERAAAAQALAEVGLALAADVEAGSWCVDGETFRYRELIKRLGGRWSGSRRRWLFRFKDEGGQGGFTVPATPAGGLAEDSATGIPAWGSKHYHGHRERLRQRFLHAGSE